MHVFCCWKGFGKGIIFDIMVQINIHWMTTGCLQNQNSWIWLRAIYMVSTDHSKAEASSVPGYLYKLRWGYKPTPPNGSLLPGTSRSYQVPGTIVLQYLVQLTSMKGIDLRPTTNITGLWCALHVKTKWLENRHSGKPKIAEKWTPDFWDHQWCPEQLNLTKQIA